MERNKFDFVNLQQLGARPTEKKVSIFYGNYQIAKITKVMISKRKKRYIHNKIHKNNNNDDKKKKQNKTYITYITITTMMIHKSEKR